MITTLLHKIIVLNRGWMKRQVILIIFPKGIRQMIRKITAYQEGQFKQAHKGHIAFPLHSEKSPARPMLFYSTNYEHQLLVQFVV